MQLTFPRLKDEQALLLGGTLTATAGIVLLRIFDPATSGVFPPCPFHALTGLYCPGCGSLRALHQLVEGNLFAAFAMNPLALLALPFLLYGAASYISLQLRGRYLPRVFLRSSWIWTFGVLVVLYGIARNIPAYPFNLLAPGGLLQ